jgi:thiamine-monophosphate kinase
MNKLTGENRIVEFLLKQYGIKSPRIKKGIGDDAAVIQMPKADEYILLTTDMLMEGIDFRQEWTTPRQLGCKSIAVNISDLAAMGARPRFFTVSLAIPSGTKESWIREFYSGLTESDSSRDALLIGGDLSHSENGIMISITAVGESLNKRVLYRCGGRPGDLIYVTGILGKSAAGLNLLKTGHRRSRVQSQKEALRAHHVPQPRCEAGEWLAQSALVRCMMDLSDGLSMDLPRMCAASGVSAEIQLNRIPVFLESRMWNCDPLELALHGGEDYELLFAVPKAKKQLLEKNYSPDFPPITLIGEMVCGNGTVWIAEPGKKRRRLSEKGYDHFRL